MQVLAQLRAASKAQFDFAEQLHKKGKLDQLNLHHPIEPQDPLNQLDDLFQIGLSGELELLDEIDQILPESLAIRSAGSFLP